MTLYRERLVPSLWIYLATALVIPASLLVFAPINIFAGIICAAVLFGGSVVLLVGMAPVIEVTETTFIAGKASIPRTLLGAPETFTGSAATVQRGPKLDTRAWLCMRGWVDPVVKIPLEDPNDPTPYWLVSTRNPKGLSAALAL